MPKQKRQVQVYDGTGIQPEGVHVFDIYAVDFELVKRGQDYEVHLEDPTDESMELLEELDLYMPIKYTFFSVNGLSILVDVEIISVTVPDTSGPRNRTVQVKTIRAPLVPYDEASML